MKNISLPMWTILAPIIAWFAYFGISLDLGSLYQFFVAACLISAVLAAVHHAEVVAHKIGEPYGSLVLALAITVIEVALIVSLMLAGGDDVASLARDTVFAAVMIILTGIVGLCLLVGGIKFKQQTFTLQGVSAALVTLTAIIVLTLILPNFTTSIKGPKYSSIQLGFVAVISLILYGTFVAVQTFRHRDFFLPKVQEQSEDLHADPPSNKTTIFSCILLLICLGVVVLLAKALSPSIESAVLNAGAPKSLVGVIIAAVVLLPEGLAAVRAAQNNRLQTSLNLAMGSAIASIGLTIPAVALLSIITGMELNLGIDNKSTVLLILAQFTIMISFSSGKTNILQGVVLLIIFASYIFTIVSP